MALRPCSLPDATGTIPDAHVPFRPHPTLLQKAWFSPTRIRSTEPRSHLARRGVTMLRFDNLMSYRSYLYKQKIKSI